MSRPSPVRPESHSGAGVDPSHSRGTGSSAIARVAAAAGTAQVCPVTERGSSSQPCLSRMCRSGAPRTCTSDSGVEDSRGAPDRRLRAHPLSAGSPNGGVDRDPDSGVRIEPRRSALPGGQVGARANVGHRPGTPLSTCSPRGSKRRPDPAVRSTTVRETRTSFGPARAAILLAM